MKILPDDLVDDGAPPAVLSLEAFFVGRLELVEVVIKDGEERSLFGPSGPIDPLPRFRDAARDPHELEAGA